MNLYEILITIVAFKAMFFGSDFSFRYWIKHKSHYYNWYVNRETFSEYLERTQKPDSDHGRCEHGVWAADHCYECEGDK